MVISVETKGNWSFLDPTNRIFIYKEKLNASAAEKFCVNQGGHLASVGSQKEQDEIEKVAGDEDVWLGGRRKERGEGWEWMDSRPWNYQNWYSGFGITEPNNDPGYDCMMLSAGGWWSWPCDQRRFFICVNDPIKMRGNQTLVFKSPSLENQTLFFWWNESTDTQGFKLDWQIENGSLPDVMELVSKDLEGSVSTPGLGSLPPPNYYKERHEYTAVIELPHNITEVIGDEAFVINIKIVSDDQSKGHVELFPG